MKIVKLMLTVLISVFLVFSTVGSAFAGANIAVLFNTTSAKVGEEVTMTVVITNTGPGDLTDVNVSAPLPVGLEFLTSGTGTTKNQYTKDTGLWQVDNLKLTSKDKGKKTLTLTAEVLPEASGKTLTATAVFLSVRNSSGDLPLKSAQSQLTIESNNTNNGDNTEKTGNTGSAVTSSTSNPVTAVSVSKTSLVAAKLNDNSTNNSSNPLNLPQETPAKAYDVYNSTEDNTQIPMSTYAIVALVGIGILVVVGYLLGIKKKT